MSLYNTSFTQYEWTKAREVNTCGEEKAYTWNGETIQGYNSKSPHNTFSYSSYLTEAEWKIKAAKVIQVLNEYMDKHNLQPAKLRTVYDQGT